MKNVSETPIEKESEEINLKEFFFSRKVKKFHGYVISHYFAMEKVVFEDKFTHKEFLEFSKDIGLFKAVTCFKMFYLVIV